MFFVIPLAIKAESDDAQSDTVILLRQASIKSGYTLQNDNGTFQVGVPPESIAGVKRTRLRISKVHKPERYSTKNETLISDLYKYKLGRGVARKVKLQNKVWLKLSYADNQSETDKVIKYWNSKKNKWKKITTSNDKDAFLAGGALKHKYAVVGVFKKRAQLGEKVVQGAASWYDGSGAACNDFEQGSTIRVTNTSTGDFVDTIIVSTGPFIPGRVVDLTRDDFATIADISTGVIDVSIQLVE
ncbi:MAG: septal ring lytic transglycosylase RlpA family protein [bacterium]|nr:septal ring lytic transglycosylase RlpA family protein [bacterium]